MSREDGSPSLDPQPEKFIEDSDVNVLVEELHGILNELPMENPPGSEDIYGLDTSIMWGSEDLEWINGGPQGCGGGTSTVQPTTEEKAKFQRAVEIVRSLL